MIISLLTDFGFKDNFVGVIKAVILKINPQAQIVDICHEIAPQDITSGAFLLKNSYRYFPPQTIHLVVIDPGVGTKRKAILVKTKNYFFIGPDNGVLSWALKEEGIEKIIEITNDKYFLKPISHTFQGRDIFAPVAAYLSAGKDYQDFGKKINRIKILKIPKIKIESNRLIGEIIHIDNFGNLITNINKEEFDEFVGNDKFRIKIRNKTILKINTSYAESRPKQILAIFNSFNNLEVSCYCSSAQKYFQAKIGLKIEILK